MAEVTKPIKVGNVWTNLISGATGESVNFEEVTEWHDGTPMDDSKCDGVIYRKLPASVGGGYVVDAKFHKSREISVDRFGIVGDGVTDNTINYARMVDALPSGTIMRFGRGLTYVGNIRVTNKSISFDLNGSTLIGVDSNAPVIRVGVSYTEIGDITSSLNYGQRSFSFDDTSSLQEGDLITVVDESARPSDSFPDINEELLKVRMVTPTVVHVEDMIRSTQSVGTIKLRKQPSIKNITIKNGIILDSVAGITFEGVDGLIVDNVQFQGIRLGHLNITRSYNTVCSNLLFKDPQGAGGGGEGYGFAGRASRNISITNVSSYKMRHTIDFSNCYTCSVDTVDAYQNVSVPLYLAHNTFGGNFNIQNIRSEGFSRPIMVGNQGVVDPAAFILRDVIIKDVEQTYNLATGSSGNSAVYIPTSHSNLRIENVTFINTNASYTNQPAHTVIELGGNSIDFSIIRNVRANRIGTVVWISPLTVNAPEVANSMTVVENLQADTCRHVVRMSGGNRVQVGNILQTLSTGISSVLVESLLGEQKVYYLDFAGTISGPNDRPALAMPVEFTTPLKGRAPTVLDLNDTPVPIGNGGGVSDIDIQKRTILRLTRINPTDSTMSSTVALPRPTHEGIEKIIILNDGNPNSASYKNLIIPTTNTFVNNGELPAVLESGASYKITSDANFRWTISRASITKTSSLSFDVSNSLLAGGVDFDTYINPGLFFKQSGAAAPNAPTGNPGYLMVMPSLSNPSVVQTYYGTNVGGRIYIRIRSSTGVWGAWSLITISSDKTAAASADVAVPPGAVYNQAEVQAILTELRDLKTKMRTAGLLET